MHIAFIVSSSLQTTPLLYQSWVIQFINTCIQQANNGIHISIISDCQNNITHTLKENNNVKIIQPQITNAISKTIWYKASLPLALKKIKATAAVHFFGVFINTSIPQFIFQPVMAQQKKSLNTSATFFHFSKNQPNYIQPSFQIHTTSININTNNAGYFVAFVQYANEQAALQLLKAFSLFKKRLLSNFFLVLIDESNNGKNNIQEKLQSYKYRTSVLLLTATLAEATTVVSNAYASIHLSSTNEFSFPLLLSIQLHIPCITSQQPTTQAFANNAALYTDDSIEMLAAQLIAIYKNEQQRSALIEACKQKSNELFAVNAVEQIFSLIQQTVSK